MDTYTKRMWYMRCRLFAWAAVMTGYCVDKPISKIMITLTYESADQYKPGHINDFMKSCKERLADKLIAFAWVAELQKRGAVHYHVLLVVQSGSILPFPDKSGMWVYGMSKIESAKTLYYICTYIGKEYQKDLSKFPKSCRLYAASVRGSKDLKDRFSDAYKVRLSKDDLVNDFSFLGATVTEDYAKFLLGSREAIEGQSRPNLSK